MPFQFLLMIGWWFFQSVQWNPKTWWQPFRTFSLGTVILQWLAVIFVGIWAANKFDRWLRKQLTKTKVLDEIR